MRTPFPKPGPVILTSWPECSDETYGEFANFIRSRLCHMPSLFERLVYIAAVNSPEGRHLLFSQFRSQRPGLPVASSNMEAVVGRQHFFAFQDWLTLGVEQKAEDLVDWASRSGRSIADLAQEWFDDAGFLQLVPTRAVPPERRLFRSEMRLLLPAAAAAESRCAEAPHSTQIVTALLA